MKKMIACLVIVFLLVSCVPKESGEMATGKFGEILAKLARSVQDTSDDPLTRGEIERLRFIGNNAHVASDRIRNLIDQKGDLDADALGGFFSTLPHETVSMYSESDQAIGNESLTTLTYDADAALSGDSLRFSWAENMKRDTSTGEIFLQGVPDETVWLFTYTVHWATTPAISYVSILEKDTATGWTNSYDDATSIDILQTGSFMMRARKAATSWQLQVYQSSGGAIDVLDALFQVVRLR